MLKFFSDKRNFVSNEVFGEFQLVLCIVMFGIAFVGMRKAMLNGGTGPNTFTALRLILSTVILSVIQLLSKRGRIVQEDEENTSILRNAPELKPEDEYKEVRLKLFWGITCGLANFGGSITQQVGLQTVTAGKTGFIVGMYVVFVPIAEWVLSGFGNTLTLKSWIASLVSE